MMFCVYLAELGQLVVEQNSKWENKVYVKGQTEYRRHVIRNLESSLLGTLGSGELISLVPLPLLSPSSGTHRYLNI